MIVQYRETYKTEKSQDIQWKELHYLKDWGTRQKIQQHKLRTIATGYNREHVKSCYELRTHQWEIETMRGLISVYQYARGLETPFTVLNVSSGSYYAFFCCAKNQFVIKNLFFHLATGGIRSSHSIY